MGSDNDPFPIYDDTEQTRELKRRADRAEHQIYDAAFGDEQSGKLETVTADSPLGPFTSRPRNYEDAQNHFRDELPADVRRRDKQTNEPIPPEYEDWKEQPRRFDWPRVDTIPREELDRRAEEVGDAFENKGIVPVQLEAFLKPGRRGITSLRTGAVTTEKDPTERSYLTISDGRTRAHELGHAVDVAAGDEERVKKVDKSGSMSNQLLASKRGDALQDQAEHLSRRMRGSFELANDRESNSEQMADSISSLLLEPTAANREAAALTDAVVDEVETETGVDFGDVVDWPANPLPEASDSPF